MAVTPIPGTDSASFVSSDGKRQEAAKITTTAVPYRSSDGTIQLSQVVVSDGSTTTFGAIPNTDSATFIDSTGKTQGATVNTDGGFYTRLGRGSGAPIVLPLQVVATRGEVSNLTTSTGLRQTGRHRDYTGGKALKTISVRDGNFYVSATAEVNGPVPFDLSRAIELNGVSIQCTWAGSPVRTVAPGEIVDCDEIPASAFGLSEIPADSLPWMRWERTRAASQQMVVHGSSAYPTLITGEGVLHRATADASQLLATGAMTTTGGWTSTFSALQYFPLGIFGRPVSKLMALYVAGASKEYGQSDTTGDGNNDGGGYVRRACQSVGGSRMPYVNTAKSGESAQIFILNSAKRRATLQYCTHALCGHGGNDFSTGQTIGNTITRITTEWAQLKAYGAKVYMILEMPKTDSTDAWATVANQTPRTGYATGSFWRDALNAYILASVGTLIDGVFDPNPIVADATFPDRWKPNATIDGTHQSKAKHIELVASLATFLLGLKTSYEAN